MTLLALVAIPLLAILFLFIGCSLQCWACRDSLRMTCSAGHVWWVRRDDAQAYGRGTAHCPWCKGGV
jgi:hypothetical protein